MTEPPKTQLILSGQNSIVTTFGHFLPPAVTAQIIETLSLDIRDPHRQVLEAAQAALQHHEWEEEQANVERLLNRAGHGSLAVVGRQATLEAANSGRIHMLMMNRDRQGSGWRCRACGRIGDDMPQQCPVCQDQVISVEIGEALVGTVLSMDGLVEQIEPHARLARYEGGLLRYR